MRYPKGEVLEVCSNAIADLQAKIKKVKDDYISKRTKQRKFIFFGPYRTILEATQELTCNIIDSPAWREHNHISRIEWEIKKIKELKWAVELSIPESEVAPRVDLTLEEFNIIAEYY